MSIFIKYTRLCFLAVFFALPVLAFGQSTQELDSALRQRITGIAKRYQDSVVLRWAPSLPSLWQRSRTSGYRIERATVRGSQVGDFVVISSKPVVPWNRAQWDEFHKSNKAVDTAANTPLIIATVLSYDSQEPLDSKPNDPGQLDAVREERDRFQMNFTLALLAAERNRDAATGLGMRFVDKTAERGVSYRYRITLLGDTKPYVVSPAEVNVGPDVSILSVAIVGLRAEEQDSSVTLVWSDSTKHSMFDVYRSVNGTSFEKITKSPSLTLSNGQRTGTTSYLDSGLTNYTTYTYKLVGYNSFGEQDELGTVKAMPRDLTPPTMPSTVRTKHQGVRDVLITWELFEPVSADLAGFVIVRDTAVDAAFDKVVTDKPLSKETREYLDKNAVLGETYYYQVVAFDTARNAVRSYPAYVAFADSVPTGPGELVRGSMDTNGVVRIVVKHPKDKDFMGYRFLHSNDPSHEFTVRRDLFNEDSIYNRSDTIILDTVEVRTLTKYAYYQVIALDYHYNESVVSNTLAVPRPDLIAPVAPVIRDYVVSDTAITLDYVPSSSKDVRNHVVLRREFDNANPDRIAWDSLGRMGIRDSVYSDKSSARSKTYQYAVVAYDSAGNKSRLSNVVSIKRVDNMKRPPVSDLTATYDSTRKSVQLRWKYQPLSEPHTFVIYRDTPSGLRSVALVKDQRLREYTDPSGGAVGTGYAIKVVCPSGAESVLSVPVKAR